MGKKLTTVEAGIMLELHVAKPKCRTTMDLLTKVSGTRKEILNSLISLQERELIKNVRATGDHNTTTWKKV